MLNTIQVIGRLGKNPELRYTQTGKEVCGFSLAVNETWTDGSGQKQERTDWIDVVCFGKTASRAASLGKGSLVFAVGKIRQNKWQDRDGATRQKHEIHADRVFAVSFPAEAREPGQDQEPDMPI